MAMGLVQLGGTVVLGLSECHNPGAWGQVWGGGGTRLYSIIVATWRTWLITTYVWGLNQLTHQDQLG